VNQNANKWVLVTGGTRGIGKGLVTHLSSIGYDVVFTYNSSEEIASQIEADAGAQGFRVKGYRCDAASIESVEKFARIALHKYGAPYAIVNNVGVTRDNLLVNMPLDSWHDVINSNINSAFYMTKQFVAPMMERGDGVILQMSSVSALRGNRGQTNYAATKAALLSFTKSLAVEVSRFNIRVNALAPGFIATEMVEKIPPLHLNAMKKAIPLGRLGKVEDVADMAEFLLSSKASYITGQTFVIDGGISI
jgi:3-oxoacyl-[acyl-carrier protein] reductase